MALGELAAYINGYAFKPIDWSKQGTPIIRIAQMTNPNAAYDKYDGILPDRYRIDTGDLLFSWSATLVAQIWTRGRAYLNQHLFKVVPTEGVESAFLHHLLNFYMDFLAAQTHGTTMRHIKRSDLLPFEVALPPLAEQQQIAEILDTIDDAIRKTEQLIAKLEQVKQGLLHDLLTRGIDDNGELRDPERHPEQFKDSVLGRIPKEWRILGLHDLAVNHDGKRIPLKQADRDQRHGSFPYYGASGIIDWVDGYIFDGDFVLLGEDGENVVSRELPLAFVVSGKFWVNNHAHVLSPISGQDVRFLTELLEATDYTPLVSGSAQPKLTQAALRHLRFRIPQASEQERIAEVLAAHTERLEIEKEEAIKFRLLKLGLMEDLLTGRVRVTPLLDMEP